MFTIEQIEIRQRATLVHDIHLWGRSVWTSLQASTAIAFLAVNVITVLLPSSAQRAARPSPGLGRPHCLRRRGRRGALSSQAEAQELPSRWSWIPRV